MIPLYKPSLNGNEKKYVEECLETGWISSLGTFVPRFEEVFSEYVGSENAVSVCNGTVALHLALLACEVGPGDEVIVPSFTYIASVNCIKYVGAKPVFASSSSDDFQIDINSVVEMISDTTKAIIVPHLYGHCCDLDNLKAVCQANKLSLIEDCAEAIGTKHRGSHVGRHGDIATYSFFGNKTITTGEGGMVCTNSDILADRVRLLKTQAVSQTREYWHEEIGYNYRMTNICAAIGLGQMEYIEDILQKKENIFQTYKAKLKSPNYSILQPKPFCKSSFWLVTLVLANQEERIGLRKFLRESGIDTRPTFPNVSSMPMYVNCKSANPLNTFPATNGLNLPSFPDLSDQEQSFIMEKVNEYFE